MGIKTIEKGGYVCAMHKDLSGPFTELMLSY